MASPVAQRPLEEGVGDSQGHQELEALAAAMESPPAGQEEQQGAAEEPRSPPPLRPAAQAFASQCRQLGLEPHPQLLDSLGKLPEEAFAEIRPMHRPGRGGAVLRLPQGTAPGHTEALLALVAGAELGGSGVTASQDRFLRTVHLDLSGAPLPAQLLQALVDAGPRLGQGYMLEGLLLAGCGLGPEVLGLLRAPRALRLLRRLRRLVLSDNPLLGRRAGAAEAGEAAPVDAFLQPGELEWLEARLLQAAPLQLLDLRRTGLSDGACAFLLERLACYQPFSSFEADHGGCRDTLTCLKLGPPADRQHFSQAAVDWLQQVLRKCPHLEAVEVLGLSPKQQGGVLAAWEEAVQRRGGDARGHPAAAEGGGLRLALTEDGALVAAERLPEEHEPLEPATPEPCFEQQWQPGPLGDVAPFPELGGGEVQQAAPAQRHAAHLQQARLHSYVQGGGLGGRQGRQQPLRAPGIRPPSAFQQEAGRDCRPGELEPSGPSAGGQRQSGGGQRQSGGGGQMQSGGGGDGFNQGGRRAGGQRRRQRQGGSRPSRADALYRGGRAEDALPMGGIDLMGDSQDFFSQDDEYESDGLAPEYSDEEDEEGEERGSSSGEESGESSGREAAPERPARRQRQEGGYHSGIEGDHFGHIRSDDEAASRYRKLLKRRFKELKEKSEDDHKQAKAKLLVWDGARSAFDRRRWMNAWKGEEDDVLHLDALLGITEILEKHKLTYPFPPMPKEKREAVLSWREAERRKEQASEAGRQQAAAAAQQQQRPAKKLRRVGEAEQDALEDSPSPMRGDAQRATQRQKRGLLVLSDSDDEDSQGPPLRRRLVAGRMAAGSEPSGASSPAAEQQQQQREDQQQEEQQREQEQQEPRGWSATASLRQVVEEVAAAAEQEHAMREAQRRQREREQEQDGEDEIVIPDSQESDF